MRFSTLVSAAAFFELSIAGYVLEDDYMTDFYSNFNFFTGPDPTDGFVNFVDEATARKSNLINGSMTTGAQFGVDVTNKTPQGRPSMRIESKKKYDNGLIVLDLAHMPFGCGTWPAFWTLGPNWPMGGEIDIIEGVNEFTNNSMTLHTAPGCQIGSDTTAFSGSVITGNCDVNAKGQSKNAGCSIGNPSTKSYGAGLNQNGGGVYAMQWNADAISVYFFTRDAIPADVLGDNPNPTTWGKPAAKFSGGCDIEKKFAEQQIIIDTTFCGAWAGDAWANGSCGKKANTCEEYVRDNPAAFTEAYWEINALKVYQDDGKAPVAPSVPATPSKTSAIPVPAPPAATVSSGYPVIAPPVSSQAVPSVPSSKSILAVPTKPAATPVVPLPSSAAVAPTKPVASPLVPLPSSVAALPEVPSAVPQPSNATSAPCSSTETPVVPLPSSAAAVPNVPLPSSVAAVPNAPSPSLAKPSKPANNQPNEPAPTGANGLPGWRWPTAGDAPAATTTAASAPQPSDAPPAQNTTGALAAPTAQQNIASPSAAPASPASQAGGAPPAAAPPVNPVAPEEPVYTVYETVYLTVPAQAAATPAPDAKNARMARHIREHRRRWTQHNARL